ncbi:MAG: TIR domain-containing protein [Erysipelotrichaceae bacterium]
MKGGENMSHKCFISFKTEDIDYKKIIQENENIDMIDKSLNEPIDSDDEDYIMRKIREDYLSDSTVTIHIIGSYSAEKNVLQNQEFIKRELQASLYNGTANTKNGILGVVLPSMYSKIYKGNYDCKSCGGKHNFVAINDETVIKEFSYNYYIPKTNGCSWSEEDRYCVLVKWDDFLSTPNYYIDEAFKKRTSDISSKTKVKP